MKLLIVFALVAFAAARPDSEYSKYDDFDADELCSNDRLMKSYTNCFNKVGKCTPEGNDFNKWMPDAIQTSCGQCNEKQKHVITKVINCIKEKLPEDWEKLNKLHNPDGKFDAPLKEFLEKYSQ